MDIKKILKNPIKWWRKQDTFIRFIVLIIIISAILIPLKVNSMTPQTDTEDEITVDTPQTYDSPSTTNTTNNTSSENPGEDYDRGYDSGYQDGVNDAYSDWPFANEPSKSLKVSDMWRQGYRDGYSQGYEDIKNGDPLKKPLLSWDAFFDPRTGEAVEY